jgi:hypothetical protein
MIENHAADRSAVDQLTQLSPAATGTSNQGHKTQFGPESVSADVYRYHSPYFDGSRCYLQTHQRFRTRIAHAASVTYRTFEVCNKDMWHKAR